MGSAPLSWCGPVSPRSVPEQGRRVWGSADSSGPFAGVVAPWPFTSAALHVLRCDERGARGLAGCSPTRALHFLRTGNFEDLTCDGVLGTFIPNLLACRLRCRLSRATASCDVRSSLPSTLRWGGVDARRRALLGLFKDRLSIGSHARVPGSGETAPRLRASLTPPGRGLPRRLRASRPGCRPRRLVTTSPGSSSCWLPGCCTRRRSWGSARFTPPRLSPRRRSPRRFPALRSFVPRGKLPDTLTRALRRLVTRPLLPACASPSPLPPHPSPLPAGTSWPCSSPGAVRSGARCRAPERRCSRGLVPRRPRVAASARDRVRQRTFERTPSR